MKNTLKKRTFISAIAMLIVSAIVLTSSTFAWFSMAKRVEVEEMSLNITSPDGVQLSGNASAFTTSLTLADLKGETSTRWAAYEGNINNFPELLKPSSSSMRVGSSLPVFYAGSINDNGRLNATKVNNDVGSGYVAFDIFVQVATDMQVYWDETTITCADNPDVLSAMRIGFVNCGTVGQKAEAPAILATLPGTANGRGCIMYEPKHNEHTEASGYVDGATVPDVYLKTEMTNIFPDGNAKNITSSNQNLSEPTLATKVNDTNMSTEAYFNAAAGINRIRVYIWMEGNDVDCANDVAGATLGFNLVFTIK